VRTGGVGAVDVVVVTEEKLAVEFANNGVRIVLFAVGVVVVVVLLLLLM
jgi:hypothetical protein